MELSVSKIYFGMLRKKGYFFRSGNSICQICSGAGADVQVQQREFKRCRQETEADKKTNAELLPWPYGHSIRPFPSALLHKSFQLTLLLHTLIAAFLASGCFPQLAASLEYEIVIL